MLNTGIVSNCWNFYLHNGVPLKDLVAHAADLQMRDVEFRQGSLGEARQIERLKRLSEDSGLDPAFAEKFLNFIVAEVIRHHEKIRGGQS